MRIFSQSVSVIAISCNVIGMLPCVLSPDECEQIRPTHINMSVLVLHVCAFISELKFWVRGVETAGCYLRIRRTVAFLWTERNTQGSKWMEVRKNACNAEGVIWAADKQQERAKRDQSGNVRRVFAEGGTVTYTDLI